MLKKTENNIGLLRFDDFFFNLYDTVKKLAEGYNFSLELTFSKKK